MYAKIRICARHVIIKTYIEMNSPRRHAMKWSRLQAQQLLLFHQDASIKMLCTFLYKIQNKNVSPALVLTTKASSLVYLYIAIIE